MRVLRQVPVRGGPYPSHGDRPAPRAHWRRVPHRHRCPGCLRRAGTPRDAPPARHRYRVDARIGLRGADRGGRGDDPEVAGDPKGLQQLGQHRISPLVSTTRALPWAYARRAPAWGDWPARATDRGGDVSVSPPEGVRRNREAGCAPERILRGQFTCRRPRWVRSTQTAKKRAVARRKGSNWREYVGIEPTGRASASHRF